MNTLFLGVASCFPGVLQPCHVPGKRSSLTAGRQGMMGGRCVLSACLQGPSSGWNPRGQKKVADDTRGG